jgi:hypothetical protein
MKGLVALLLAAGVAAACASAGPAPQAVTTTTPSPRVAIPFLTQAPPTLAPGETPTSRPSGSCIFALDVDNQTASHVTVAVNGAALGNVAAGGFSRFYAGMNGPPLPWAVVVTRTSDGEALASKYYPEGTLEGRITVRDAPHEPQAVAAGYCP